MKALILLALAVAILSGCGAPPPNIYVIQPGPTPVPTPPPCPYPAYFESCISVISLVETGGVTLCHQFEGSTTREVIHVTSENAACTLTGAPEIGRVRAVLDRLRAHEPETEDLPSLLQDLSNLCADLAF